MAAALVLASLQAGRLRAVGASVPTLALAVVTYSLGVVAVAPVHCVRATTAGSARTR